MNILRRQNPALLLSRLPPTQPLALPRVGILAQTQHDNALENTLWLRPSNCAVNANSLPCTYAVLHKHRRARNSVRRPAPRLPHTLCTLHSHADFSDAHPYSTAHPLRTQVPPHIQMLSHTFTTNRQPTNQLPSSIPSRGLLGLPQSTDTTRSASGLPVARRSTPHPFLPTHTGLNLSLNRDLPAYHNTTRSPVPGRSNRY